MPEDFFISYARANRLAKALVHDLKEQMAPAKERDYQLWQDEEILIGEDWDVAIRRALRDCRFGFLLVSPAFLASDYITQTELPALMNTPGKAVFPVLLEDVDFDRHDLKGLEAKQIFRHVTPSGKQLSYSKCRADQRLEFAEKLFQAIDRRLDKMAWPSIP